MSEKASDTLTQDNHKACSIDCKHNRRDDIGHMIRCCQCAVWFHLDCLNISKEESEGVWPCYRCRRIPDKIDFIQECIKKLMIGQEQLTKNVKDNTKNLASLETESIIQSEALGAVKEMFEEMKRKEPVPAAQMPRPPPTPTPEVKDIIIGDSLVQDMTPTTSNIEIVMLKGKRMSDMTIKINEMESCNEVFIIAGSNDCSSGNTTDNILADCTEMVKAAKHKSDKITLSSIPPRDNDNGAAIDKKIQDVNAHMEQLCLDENITFVDNDINFRYQNGDYDDDLLKGDKIHLSKKGVTKLVRNLGLSDRVTWRAGSNASWWQQSAICAII